MEHDIAEKSECVSKEPWGINGNVLGVRLATLFILSVVIFTSIFNGNNEIIINPNPEILDRVEVVKVRDDPGFDVFIGSYIQSDDLIAEFYHDSENPLPISVIGLEDYQRRYFKLQVGHDSEVFEFGILVTRAVHLDENRTVIADVFEEVKAKDYVWSEPIYEGEYVSVTFEKNLTSVNDITVYTRNNQGLNTKIEVYY